MGFGAVSIPSDPQTLEKNEKRENNLGGTVRPGLPLEPGTQSLAIGKARPSKIPHNTLGSATNVVGSNTTSSDEKKGKVCDTTELARNTYKPKLASGTLDSLSWLSNLFGRRARSLRPTSPRANRTPAKAPLWPPESKTYAQTGLEIESR